MRSLFIDDQDQLRSGWRALIFLLAFVFLAVVLGSLAQISLSILNLEAPPGSPLNLTVNALASFTAAILIGWLCGKLLEKLPFRAMGASLTSRSVFNLMAGLLLGSTTIGLAVFIAYAFGGLRFEWDHDGGQTVVSSLLTSLAVFAAAAAFEEALFRGYILQTLTRAGLAWLAIILTSIFFGAVHIDNPNATVVSTLNTILAGVWFSLAYLKTRDLWFVWGLHLMWNWVQGSIFGIEVSGLSGIFGSALLREIDSGPTWLTGHTYGIEGGIACTVALLVSMGLIHYSPILRSEPPGGSTKRSGS